MGSSSTTRTVDIVPIVAPRPTCCGDARAQSSLDRADRHPAQRVPCRRVDEREVEMPDEQGDARRTSARRGGGPCSRSGSVVSRSPNQSSSPETTKSTVNAAVSAALIFWPALKLALRRRLAAQPAEVVVVERRRARGPCAARPRRSPSTSDERERAEPADARPEVDVLDERPARRRAPTRLGR